MTYTKTAVLPVPPEEAFALLTEPERLRRWQAVSARVDLRAGGEYRWTVTPGHVAAGTFREVEPGRRVVFGWGWEGNPDLQPDASTVTVTVEPTEGGTRVTLEHDGLTEEQAASHAEGWSHYFERLERAAAQGDAGSDEWAAVPAQLDELSAAEATLAVLQGLLRNLTAEDQQRQTPCTEYTCHELAEHVFGSITGLGSMAGATVTNPGAGPLEHRVATMAAQAMEAWRARGLDGTVPAPGGGEMPAAMAAGILSVEFLLHGWDFAQASGQEVVVADEVVEYVRSIAEKLVPAGRERGAFAEEQAPTPDADALGRLAAYAGRTPVASTA
jgi:uncharacterized protein (TIGR03086 family)